MRINLGTRGPKNVNAKLTVKDVVHIRALRSAGMRLAKVGQRFGISTAQAAKICRHESWGWVK